ncbi:hypothetical protein F4777DRAFT_592427 [Nemania sp. FL0916]|nr:hypothetical protein F4777DRAFT_592427 [Nemania sp. FL0916]
MLPRSTRQLIAPLRRSIASTQRIPRPSIAILRLPHARFSSSQPPQYQEPHGHRAFYKTFGRPIAKVFLMAIFVYQVAYFVWVKLEQDEMRAEAQAIISDLEARIEKLEQARALKKP